MTRDDGGLYFDRLDWRLAKKWSMQKIHDVELQVFGKFV
jgi:hypothetical protein